MPTGYVQFVMGPAGSGKSTYCATIHEHCVNTKRKCHIINLDPAAEMFSYPVSLDIRDLISLQDVMDELKYGPNGGLIFCMEYLLQNLDWLEEELQHFTDEDFIIFDLPGQIELFTHIPVLKEFAEILHKWGYRICSVYLIDSQFISDAPKFISAALMCLSVMVQMELPHINVITKMDLVKKKKDMDDFFDADMEVLLARLSQSTDNRFKKLNHALASLIDDYSMVKFVPLDRTDPDTISILLQQVDNAVQFGEEQEPNIPRDEDDMDFTEGYTGGEIDDFPEDMDNDGGDGAYGYEDDDE